MNLKALVTFPVNAFYQLKIYLRIKIQKEKMRKKKRKIFLHLVDNFEKADIEPKLARKLANNYTSIGDLFFKVKYFK